MLSLSLFPSCKCALNPRFRECLPSRKVLPVPIRWSRLFVGVESETESRVENRRSIRARENHFRFIHGRRFRQPEIRGVPRPWPPLDRLALILIDVDLVAVLYTLDLIRAYTCACVSVHTHMEAGGEFGARDTHFRRCVVHMRER